MADIAVARAAKNASVVQTLTQVNASDTILAPKSGDELVVNNGGGSPINVTLTALQACDQETLHDVVIAVTNGTTRKIPMPVPLSRYLNTAGNLPVTYSATTSVSAGAFGRSF
jgi:hypothetical protein